MMRIAEWTVVAVFVGLLGWLGVSIHHAYAQSRLYEGEHTARLKAEADHAEYVRLDTLDHTKRDNASQGYQDEIAALRARNISGTIGPVRLCVSPRQHLPAAEAPAGGPPTAAPGAGVLSAGTAADTEQGPGVIDPPDIGPDLARLIERAEILSAQLRYILQYEGE